MSHNFKLWFEGHSPSMHILMILYPSKSRVLFICLHLMSCMNKRHSQTNRLPTLLNAVTSDDDTALLASIGGLLLTQKSTMCHAIDKKIQTVVL